MEWHFLAAVSCMLLCLAATQPDVVVTEFSYSLSGASLYQDIPSRVKFSTSFVNVAEAGNDVAAADVLSSNYMVELVVSDADLSLSGQSDSLQIPPAWPQFNSEEAVKLGAGLQSDHKETLTLTGTADILVSSTECRPQMFLCAHVWLPGIDPVNKITPENGTNYENETVPEPESHPENDYKCTDLTGIVQCSADHIDLSIQQFDMVDGILHSGGFGHLMLALKVTIGGSYQLTPAMSGNYKVQLYLSTDDDISTDLDMKLEGVPRHFDRLTTDFTQSGSLFLGGPDLAVPDIHSVAGQIYCGPVYLGVMVDPGQGNGKVEESDENNNAMVIPVTVICPNDLWGVRDVTVDLGSSQMVLYPATAYRVRVDVTVDNFHNETYSGNRAAFQLKLYLHNSAKLGQGGNPLDLTRINSIEYPGGVSPMSVIPRYSSLRMTGVIFDIAEDMITADNGYTYLIVKIEPTESSTSRDEVGVNDFVALPISIGSAAYDVDLVLTSFDISESRVIVEGVTSATVTLSGMVTLGTVESTSFQSRLYWSKDQVLDDLDIDSGLQVEVVADGSVVRFDTNTFIPTPSDLTFCGQVFAILHVDSTHQVAELSESNNYLVDTIALACKGEDQLALMNFELLPPQQTFVKGQDLTFTFKAKVACTLSDCSSMTSGKQNFGLQLFFDTDLAKESEPELTVKGGFQVTDGGQGFNSDLSTGAVEVTMKVTVTVETLYCDKAYRYMGLVLTPGDGYTSNDWLTVPVHIDCTNKGVIDVSVTSFTGVTSLDTENVTPFAATVSVKTKGTLALPQLDWPLIDVKFYLSTDDQIDPRVDTVLPYFLTPKQRQTMSGKIDSSSTVSWDIGVKLPDGLALPRVGLERFCGRDVFVGLVLDPGNLLVESDETNNVAVSAKIPAASVHGLSCDTHSPSQTLLLAWEGGRLPPVIFPYSTYVMYMKVRVTNAHTAALSSSSGINGTENFRVSAYLSANDTVSNTDDKQLVVEVASQDLGKTSVGIPAGDSIVLNVVVTLAFGQLDQDSCKVLSTAIPQILLVLTDVSDDSGFTAGPPAPLPITLMCQLRLEPELIHVEGDTRIWQDNYYNFKFKIKVTHQGWTSDFFKTDGSNFLVRMAIIASSGQRMTLKILPANPEVQQQVIPVNDTVIVRANAVLSMPSYACGNFTKKNQFEVTLIPEGDLLSHGYTESTVVSDITDFTFECSDSYLDLSVTAFSLIDTVSGEPINKITIGKQAEFNLGVMVKVGKTDGIVSFTAEDSPNYEYRFYISRNPDTIQYQIDYTPQNEDLKAAVDEDGTHTMSGSDLLVPVANGQVFCGVIYFTVALFDLRNDNGVVHRAAITEESIRELLQRDNPKDPKVSLDNYSTRKILLECPGDLFLLTNVQFVTANILPGPDATLVFNGIVINSQSNGYDIPMSSSGFPNFDFKVLTADGTSLPLTNVSFRDADVSKLSQRIPAAEWVELSGVEIKLAVDDATCTAISAGGTSLMIVAGIGLAAGLLEEGDFKDNISISLSCNTKPQDFHAVSLNFDRVNAVIGSSVTVSGTLKVEISNSADATTAPNVSVKLYIANDATLDHPLSIDDTQPTKTQKAGSSDVTVWSKSIRFTLVKDDWDKYCGRRLAVVAVADPDGVVVEPDEANNRVVGRAVIACDGDLYDAVFVIETNDVFYPDIPFTFLFEGSVRNMASTNVNAATGTAKNFNFRLYAQKGSIMNKLKAVEVTPDWRYTTTTDEAKLSASHASDGELKFSQVMAQLQLPRAVCVLGMDHLFLSVDAAPLPTGHTYYESLSGNNYVTVPITCSTSGGFDVGVKTLRSGEVLFKLGQENTLVLGEAIPFQLLVDVSVAGSGGWSKQPSEAEPMFTYRLSLESAKGKTKTLAVDVKTSIINQEVRTSITMNLGGPITLEPSEYLGFCGSGNKLHVTLDPDNAVTELDELNNEAVIEGVTVAADIDASTDVCSEGVDLVLESVSIGEGCCSAELVAGDTMTYYFKYHIVKGGASDPPQFKYKAFISIDKDLKASTTRMITNGEETWATSGGTTASFQGRVSVMLSDGVEMLENQIYCSLSPYIGVNINSDKAINEMSMDNNIVWKKIRFVCSDIYGLALSGLEITRSNHDKAIQGGTNTIELKTELLNKGIAIKKPKEWDLFKFKLYISPAPSIDEADGAKELDVSWSHKEPWNVGLVAHTVKILSDVSATITLPPGECNDKTHLCLEVKGADGMPPYWVDSFQQDDYACYNLYGNPFILDCGREIAINKLVVTPSGTRKIFQNMDLKVQLSISYRLSGQPLGASNTPTLGFTALLSDRDTPEPSVSFNRGQEVVLATPERISWQEDSMKVLQGWQHENDTRTVVGVIPLHISSQLCSTEPRSRFVCVRYTLTIPSTDSDMSNDYQCIDISSHLDCSSDTVDLEPMLFDVSDGMFAPLTPKNFNLVVKVNSAADIKLGMFQSQLYLSDTPNLESGNARKILYTGFMYGPALSETQRHLSAGVHTINVGGTPIILPESTRLQGFNFCGQAFLVVVINSELDVAETDSSNNMISAPVVITCKDDAFMLSDLTLDMSTPRYAEEPQRVRFSVTVQNMRSLQLPVPSPGAPNYSLKMILLSGTSKILSVEAISYPLRYYRPMQPLESIRLNGVEVAMRYMTLTETNCKRITHLAVELVTDATDTVLNHRIEIPVTVSQKTCQPISANRQLSLDKFQVPAKIAASTVVPVAMSMTARVGNDAPALGRNAFVSMLYISRDNKLDSFDYMWTAIPHTTVVAVGETTVLDMSEALRLDVKNRKYCGPVYLHAVIDKDNEITEPREDHHHLMTQTTVLCDGDFFAVSDFSFETLNERLVENYDVPFSMSVMVTCTKPHCAIAMAAENIKLFLEFGSSLPVQLAEVTTVWDLGNQGRSVTPSLGTGFSYEHPSVEFAVKGAAKIPEGSCDGSGQGTVGVRVTFGSDLSSQKDSVQENNVFILNYPCSKEKRRDIKVSSMKLLSGDIVNGEEWVKFEMSVAVDGEDIPAMEAAPTVTPFDIAFYLSDDDVVSDDDTHLEYSVSWGASEVLKSGLQGGKTLVIQDLKGVYIPPSRCGAQFIIVHIDSTDKYEETLEYNNFLAMSVYVKCDMDLLKMTKASVRQSLPHIWADVSARVTVNLTLANSFLGDMPPCASPCQGVTVFAAVSNDDVWGHDVDSMVREYRLNSAEVSQLMMRDASFTMQDWDMDLLVATSDCESSNYLIVGAYITGQQVMPEDNLINNYRALPLSLRCSFPTDVKVTQLMVTPSSLLPGAEVKYIADVKVTVAFKDSVDPFVYQLWLSTDDKLDPQSDHRLGFTVNTKSMKRVFKSSTSFSVPGTVVIPSDLSAVYCGPVFFIAEVDSTNVVNEVDEMNNVLVQKITVDCAQDVLFIDNLEMTSEGDMLVAGSPTRFNVSLDVVCTARSCPGAATSGSYGFPIHFTILLKVWDEHYVEVGTFGTIDAQFVASSIDNPTVQFDPPHGLQTDFTTATDHSVHLTISADFMFAKSAPCERAKYIGAMLVKGNSDQVVSATWRILENDVKYVSFQFKCIKDTIKVDFEVAEFTVDNKTSDVIIDLSSNNEMTINLSVRSTTSLWPVMQNNEPVFDLAFYIAPGGSQSVSEGVDLRFRPSKTLGKRLHESPEAGVNFDLSLGWYPEERAQLAAFCGRPAVLQVLVDAFNRVSETDESNNVASVAVTMANCPAGHDVLVTNLIVPDLLTSGEAVNFNLTLEAILIGEGSVSAPSADKVTMKLIRHGGDPGTALQVDIDNYPEGPLEGSKPDTAVRKTYTWHGTVKIPPDDKYCDHAWLLEVAYDNEDLYMNNNRRQHHIIIACPDDQLSLVGFELGSLPTKWWPLLSVDIKVKVTAKNRLTTLRKSSAGLFKVKMYFSSDGEFDPTVDGLAAQLNGIAYKFTEEMPARDTIDTVWLIGKAEISSLAQCVAASKADATPALFVVIEAVDVSHSKFIRNDRLAFPLNPEMFHCKDALVDLSVKAFGPGGTVLQPVLQPDTDVPYTLTVGVRKTQKGAVASTDGEPNIRIQIYMSIDRHLDTGDMSLDIKPDAAQMATLRRGISSWGSTGSLSLNGARMNLEMTIFPQRRFYCGNIYLIAEVKVMKVIDPNIENNVFAKRVLVYCNGDTLGFGSFQLKPELPQRIIYSTVNTTFTFTAVIMNWGMEAIPASIDGHPNIYMKAYMSMNRELELGYDAEVPLVTLNPRMIGQLDERFPGRKMMRLVGKVTGVLPETVCTSPYLFMKIDGGSRIADSIPDDNTRFIDLSKKIRCNMNYIDFTVKSFSLPGGSTLVLGTSFPYELTAMIEINGDRSLGNASMSVFRFQFYVSQDKMLDDSDLSLEYGGAEQGPALTRVFHETAFVSLNSGTEKVHLPVLLDPWLCGKVYLLAVVDSLDWFEEMSEYNNIFAHEVTINCQYDVLSLVKAELLGSPTTVFSKSPTPLHISLTVANLLQHDLMSDASKNPIVEVKVLMKARSGSLMTEVTPNSWKFLDAENPFTHTIPAGGNLTISRLSGDIDVTRLCEGPNNMDNLTTGPAILVIEVLKGRSLASYVEAVIENNRYEIPAVEVSCSDDLIDLRPADRPSFALASGDRALKLGLNPFKYSVFVLVLGSGGWTAATQSSFLYKFSVIAGPLTVDIPHNNSRTTGLISQDTTQDRYIDLSDTESGLDLSSEDFLFLCDYSGAIMLTATADATNLLPEINEENNMVKISHLRIDKELCSDAIDLRPTVFRVRDLDYDVMQPDTPSAYRLQVAVSVVGKGMPANVSSEGAEQFKWSYVLSADNIYNASEDVIINAEDMNEAQRQLLQPEFSKGQTQVLVLDGSGLTIPLTRDTYKYCWSKVYVGVLVDSGQRWSEASETNNVLFYDVIFDCGDNVDECSHDLHDCDEHAMCHDNIYRGSVTDLSYNCTCNTGYFGDGKYCNGTLLGSPCASDRSPCSDIPHSTCEETDETDTSYDCICQEGFKKTVLSGGDHSCDNMDECANSELYSCHADAYCIDTIGSYECKCKVGFVGTGQDCVDKDYCERDSCNGHGNCTDGLERFTCECESPYTGASCDKVMGGWGEWSAWSECRADCGPGFRNRSRDCDSPPPVGQGMSCQQLSGEVDVQHTDCQIRACAPGHIPWCDYDPCFNNQGGICVYKSRGKSYECLCKVGYKYIQDNDKLFIRCQDVDECSGSKPLHNCHKYAACNNTQSSFKCQCTVGFTGNGTYCEDIDECTANATATCPEQSDCINSPSSFKCVCRQGYKNTTLHSKTVCLEERLFAYGIQAGDTEVTAISSVTTERASKYLVLPYGLPLFEGQVYNSVYISENGLLVVTNDFLENDRKETYSYPNPLDSRAFDGVEPQVGALIAPFWADTESSAVFYKVWYQVYTNSKDKMFSEVKELLRKGTGVTFEPTYILKVTWHEMAPIYHSKLTERNTFQTVLLTDHVHTYVMYIYKTAAMNWEPTAYNTSLLHSLYKGYPARIGFAVRGTNSKVHAIEDPNSAKWSVNASRLNAYRVSEKQLQSHGLEGRLFYQLDDNNDDFMMPRIKCKSWHENEPSPLTWGADLVNTCPPNLFQAEKDGRFRRDTTLTPLGRLCFNRNVANSHGASIRCCYLQGGSLIDTNLTASDLNELGLMSRYKHDVERTSDFYKNDLLPFEWCCQKSGYPEYCSKYIEKRPLVTSTHYNHVKMGTVQGSVHLMTVEDVKFTFAGFGEYVLLQSTVKMTATLPVTIQMRTALITGQNGINSKMTVVTGVALQSGGSDATRLQAYLRSDGSIDIYVNGGKYDPTKKILGAAAMVQGGRVTFSSQCGVSVIVVAVDNRRLSVSVQVPVSLLDGYVEGLLGHFSGVPSTMSMENYWTYGEKWSLRNVYGAANVDVKTLFTQYTTPDSAGRYFRAGFKPQFLGPTDYTAAQIVACTPQGAYSPLKACLYDYAVSGNQELAVQNIDIANRFKEEYNVLGNDPPKFVRSTTTTYLTALINSKAFINIQAVDSTPGNIKFSIVIKDATGMPRTVPLSTSKESSTLYSSTFYWTPESGDTLLEYHVEDAAGARSILTPHVLMCNCLNGGKCDITRIKRWRGNIAYGTCECPSGWVGDFCNTEPESCQVKHCFGGCISLNVTYMNEIGDKRGYSCEPCPEGMEGDGTTCLDVNECLLGLRDMRRHQCTQLCDNVPDTYRCSCQPGFILATDGHSCTDIRECSNPLLNGCDQESTNCKELLTSDGYMCKCKPGFKPISDKACIDTDECAEDNGGCQRTCVNTIGSFYCDCGYGYLQVPKTNGSKCQSARLCSMNPVCHGQCVPSPRHGFYTCSCDGGLKPDRNGVDCIAMDTMCKTLKCDKTHGYCATQGSDEACHCERGYKLSAVDKTRCVEIDECATGTAVCGPHTTCVNTAGAYTCVCKPGYEPSLHNPFTCNNINECAANTTTSKCQHQCVDTDGSFVCTCLTGHYLDTDGASCIDMDECAPGVINKCSPEAECIDRKGGYECICPAGFTDIGDGFTCEDINECFHDNGDCEGVCENIHGSYRCSCFNGYMIDPNNTKGCLDVNECLHPNVDCMHGCENTDGSYHCTCRDGFELAPDGSTCEVVIETCVKECGSGGDCAVINDNDHCICHTGYKLDKAGVCVDVDECETHTHDCEAPGAWCNNLEGSYECVCHPSFQLRLDGLSCIDINECEETNVTLRHKCDDVSTTCVNTLGSYSCQCRSGFTFKDPFTCEDIDECDELEMKRRMCHEHGVCRNTPGSFMCYCQNGYTGDGLRNCQDIDECASASLNSCGLNATCVNRNGSYDCPCKPNFKFIPQVNKCLDVDECSSVVLNKCETLCHNTVGGFQCSCRSGYELNQQDGRTCEVVDVCLSSLATTCQQACVKNHCDCAEGYFVKDTKCLDIDECTNKRYRHSCGAHSQCRNTDGSYICVCDRHYILDHDGMSCSETDGNWGAWNLWNMCSRSCRGRLMRKRDCNQPPSSRGRHCVGDGMEYVECNMDVVGDCRAQENEVEKGVFMTFPELVVSHWESIEPAVRKATCTSLNEYCSNTIDGFIRCCGKGPPNSKVPKGKFCPYTSNVKLGSGYPRPADTGTRVLLHVDVPISNLLCGNMNGRSKRDTVSPPTTYGVPQDLLLEVMNGTLAERNVKQAIETSDTPYEPEEVSYVVAPAIQEDEPEVFEHTIDPVDYGPVIRVSMAVFFTLLGGIILALSIFCLIRSTYQVSDSQEDLMMVNSEAKFEDMEGTETRDDSRLSQFLTSDEKQKWAETTDEESRKPSQQGDVVSLKSVKTPSDEPKQVETPSGELKQVEIPSGEPKHVEPPDDKLTEEVATSGTPEDETQKITTS